MHYRAVLISRLLPVLSFHCDRSDTATATATATVFVTVTVYPVALTAASLSLRARSEFSDLLAFPQSRPNFPGGRPRGLDQPPGPTFWRKEESHLHPPYSLYSFVRTARC